MERVESRSGLALILIVLGVVLAANFLAQNNSTDEKTIVGFSFFDQDKAITTYCQENKVCINGECTNNEADVIKYCNTWIQVQNVS